MNQRSGVMNTYKEQSCKAMRSEFHLRCVYVKQHLYSFGFVENWLYLRMESVTDGGVVSPPKACGKSKYIILKKEWQTWFEVR